MLASEKNIDLPSIYSLAAENKIREKVEQANEYYESLKKVNLWKQEKNTIIVLEENRL